MVTDKSVLVPFLRRYPWADRPFLENIFGWRTVKVMLENAGDQVRRETLPEIGECFAASGEPDFSLLDLWRIRYVRNFALEVMGVDGIMDGFAPTPLADGEFFWEGLWYRLWADIGGVAPEALGFIRHPPRTYGPGVRDLILTIDPGRFESLAAQINMNWGGSEDVFIWCLNAGAHWVVKHSSYFGSEWTPYTEEQQQAYFARRRATDKKKEQLGRLALGLAPLDWSMLSEAGNNPFLTEWELSYMTALRLVGADFDHRHLLNKLSLAKKHARALKDRLLLEQPRLKKRLGRHQPLVELLGRLIPSWRGLEMLAGYLGIDPEDMRRFQPWPQKIEKRKDSQAHKEHLAYSDRWVSRLSAHQSLCRTFCLSLLFGGRSVANGLGWPIIDVVTTIASRLLYQQLAYTGEKTVEWVIPDGLVNATIWGRPADAGPQGVAKLLVRRALYLEIDRATNPIGRLDDRLDRYAQVWRYLRERSPALVWVIVGTPYRENEILDKMRARKLDGWTVLMERLALSKDNPWWTLVPPVFGELEFKAIGGLAPYRPVWSHTGAPVGRHNLPFLGHAPWWSNNQIYDRASHIYKGG